MSHPKSCKEWIIHVALSSITAIALGGVSPVFAQGGDPVTLGYGSIWKSDFTAPITIILICLVLVGVVILRSKSEPKASRDESANSSTTPNPTSPIPTPRVEVAVESPKSIFVSYRRLDSQHITGRIYDRLATKFGKTSVYKDVDSIPLGLDFREHLQEQVSRCSVLVAVIGKNWNPTSRSGDERLKDQRDYLRIEIETALERRIPVIPVLVDGVEMPREEELPPSLSRLAYHNGISIRPDPDFHNDADRLIRGIQSLLG
jgi:hypothetical protein